ncbi:DUF6684 family protein, partial [Halobium palmae]
MATNKIFDRETLLDLTVNFVPLFIILFFIGVLVVTDPWPELSGFLFIVAIGLHVVPFVALAILTYVSGKAIAGDEKTQTVFPPGQATVPGTQPLEHGEGESTDETAAIEGETTETPTTDEGTASGEATDASTAESADP